LRTIVRLAVIAIAEISSQFSVLSSQ